jgi:hypothetical protein
MRHFASYMNFPAQHRLRLACHWKDFVCRNWEQGERRSLTDRVGFAASWSDTGETVLAVGLDSCTE